MFSKLALSLFSVLVTNTKISYICVCKYLISKVSFFKILYFSYVTDTDLVLDGFHGNSDLVTRVPQLLRN
jgi:hypothetical protein